MLSTEELQAIKERCEKATHGPWQLDESDNGLWNNGGYNFIGALSSFYDYDAEFIANARQDIANLLAEIERITECLKTIGKLTSCDDTHDFINRALKGEEKTILPYRFSISEVIPND